MEKNLEGNYTRMLRAILNESKRQHATKQQLCGHLPPITKNMQVRRTRHTWDCWRSKNDLISDILLWTPSHWRAKAGRPAGTYIQQLCASTGCSLEDLPGVMDDREGWWERVREIRGDRNVTVYKLFVVDRNNWHRVQKKNPNQQTQKNLLRNNNNNNNVKI